MIDLHIHTNASDGVLSSYEVIDYAYQNGIKYISITDHDTIEAYTDDLIKYANKLGVKLIYGVEISTKDRCGIHILGYNIDISNEELKNGLKKIREERHNYLYNVSKKLNELGYYVDIETLDKIDSVTKAHIALDVINNPINKDILISYFNHIPSKGEFIETLMNEGCPAYYKKTTVTPSEAASLIRGANGKVVIAHPVAYEYEDSLTEADVLNILKNTNADGVEAYYIYIDRNNVKHNDIDKWVRFAKDSNIFVTVGSDFHNNDNIHPLIGLIGEDISYDEDTIINNINR